MHFPNPADRERAVCLVAAAQASRVVLDRAGIRRSDDRMSVAAERYLGLDTVQPMLAYETECQMERARVIVHNRLNRQVVK